MDWARASIIFSKSGLVNAVARGSRKKKEKTWLRQTFIININTVQHPPTVSWIHMYITTATHVQVFNRCVYTVVSRLVYADDGVWKVHAVNRLSWTQIRNQFSHNSNYNELSVNRCAYLYHRPTHVKCKMISHYMEYSLIVSVIVDHWQKARLNRFISMTLSDLERLLVAHFLGESPYTCPCLLTDNDQNENA